MGGLLYFEHLWPISDISAFPRPRDSQHPYFLFSQSAREEAASTTNTIGQLLAPLLRVSSHFFSLLGSRSSSRDRIELVGEAILTPASAGVDVEGWLLFYFEQQCPPVYAR